MSAMCQHCGLEQATIGSDNLNQIPMCKECESSYDDTRVQLSERTREHEADDLDTGQRHSKPATIEHLVVDKHLESLEDNNVENSNTNYCLNEPTLPLTVEEYYGKGRENEKMEYHKYSDVSNGVDDSFSKSDDSFSKSPYILDDETDPQIWIPPEPENSELDIDSVANNDDDEYCNDGIVWGQPSSLNSLENEFGNNHNHKEERQKAMMEAMNGQFKILVHRLLASEGIDLYNKEGCENWLDIVTSLSWEAALLIKPDANEGKAMDPASYVKIKCIASGTPNQSQVIKGLVFKKSTAHKHMPTKLKNPKLLLIQGSIGHSAIGLSSFKSMGQEDEFKKSFLKMIESCNPNLVLVEKSVSRDIQGALLDKGIALIVDMKLPRLERIARFTGSHLLSSEKMMEVPKLKQCDYFHVEKLVEEHNIASEGGKKPNKTLMFLEGCPRPLGCTILLKGSHQDELKKVKHVLHYAVFAAYHLVLETSFFADQRIFFHNTNTGKELNGMLSENLVSSESDTISITNNISDSTLEIPVSDESIDILLQDGRKFYSELDTRQSFSVREDISSRDQFCAEEIIQTLDSDRLQSCVSASLKKLIGNSLPPLSTDSISSCFGFSDTVPLVSPHNPATFDHEVEENNKIKQDRLDLGVINRENASPHASTTFDTVAEEINKIKQDELDLEINNCENAEKGEEKSTTEVQIEGKSDFESALDPQSILILLSTYSVLKQTVCEQSHLSRIKYYGNFDISLGIYLRDNLLSQKHTCTYCGEPPENHVYRYTHQNGNLIVLVKRLSKKYTLPGEAEGKIWMWTRCLKCEQESGTHKSTKRVLMSSAAHGLSFGKFLELSFSNHSAASRLSKCGHLLHRDCLRFFGLGSKVAMFKYTPVEIYAVSRPPPILEFCNPSEQEWFLKEASEILSTEDRFFKETAELLKNLKPKFPSTMVEFNNVEEMMKQEKNEFEASLKINAGHEMHANLNWSMLELLLLLYIWDSRLHSIFQNTEDGETTTDDVDEQHFKANHKNHEGDILENGHEVLESPNQIPIDLNDFSSSGDNQEDICTSLESMTKESSSSLLSNDTIEIEVVDPMKEDHVQEDNFIPILIGPLDGSILGVDESQRSDNSIPIPITPFDDTEMGGHESQKSEDSKNVQQKHMWPTFSDLRTELKNDLHGGYLQKFEFINSYSPTFLSPMMQIATRVKDSLHFPISSSGSVISVIEDEISSIIACALSLSEKDNKENDGDGKNALWAHMTSSRSFSSLTSDELTILGSDGSLFSDRIKPMEENMHHEISVGVEKISGKSKYSVVCIYAKQFHSLRMRCCSSETAYISSLSRCKKWDAQGGKSKVLFAKTMDDRFIIKQIKKPELESFLKFGPDYFKYITLSLDSGSQSCLAKILGIYQVRQYKNGREIKTDVIVMENLFFGRNITRKYDLKGAVFARYISNSNDSESVLLDENFVQDMRISPIYVGGKNKHLLQRAIWNDTSFLTSMNVMDYSLLVGVDTKKHEIVFGIIDYLRQYTWDKQLETWVKASLVVPKNELPTIISPKDYKKRFRKFMTKYFLTVPDSWEQ